MTAIFIPASTRISCSDNSRSIKMRTPDGDVNMIQSGRLSPALSSAIFRSSAGFGSIGTVSMAGISRTSAPALRRRTAISEMSSFGLVSRIFLPARGRFSAQAKESASRQTSPTTIMAGAWICAPAASCSSVETVARTRFCRAVVPLSSTAAGRSGSIPAKSSPFIMAGRFERPIRKINVPCVRTRAS